MLLFGLAIAHLQADTGGWELNDATASRRVTAERCDCWEASPPWADCSVSLSQTATGGGVLRLAAGEHSSFVGASWEEPVRRRKGHSLCFSLTPLPVLSG